MPWIFKTFPACIYSRLHSNRVYLVILSTQRTCHNEILKRQKGGKSRIEARFLSLTPRVSMRIE